MAVTVGAAQIADADDIARLLARAFLADPVMAWVFPREDTRARQLQRLYHSIVRWGGIQSGVTQVGREGSSALRGAGLWRRRVGRAGFVWRDIPFALGSGLALGRDMGRMIAMGRSVSTPHPHEPHWYLQLLGVDPDAQGSGVGTALVQAQLAIVDAEHLPAYLETTEQNLEFYARFGFGATGEIRLPGGPSQYSLWRAASGR